MGVGSLFLAIGAFLAWVFESRENKEPFILSATSMLLLSLFTIVLNLNGSVYFPSLNLAIYPGILLLYFFAFFLVLQKSIDLALFSGICITALAALLLARFSIYSGGIGSTGAVLAIWAIALLFSKKTEEGIVFSAGGVLFYHLFRQLIMGEGIVIGSAGEFNHAVFSILLICCYYAIADFSREFAPQPVFLDKRERFPA